LPGHPADTRYFTNYDRAEVSLSGPEPFTTYILPTFGVKLPGPVSYFLATDGEWVDGYVTYARNWQPRYKIGGISFQDRRKNTYTANAKLTFKPGNKTLTLSWRGHRAFGFGWSRRGEYSREYHYIPEFAARPYEESNQMHLYWNHPLTKNTFYTLNFSRNMIHYRQTPGGKTPGELSEYGWTSENPLDHIYNVDGDNEPFIDEARYNGIWDEEEFYIDQNGNNQYDLGEPFVDKATPNGYYDPGETFRDYNGNGTWDGTEPYFDYGLDGIDGTDDEGEGNSLYDLGEPYIDANRNGRYDQLIEDGFFDWGYDRWMVWRDYRTVTYTFKGDITSQVNKANLLKTGVEVNYYDVRKGELQYPWIPYDGPTDIVSWAPENGWPSRGAFRDFYIRKPFQGAIYIQDKIETEGMIVNAGLRFDYWDPAIREWEDPITLVKIKVPRRPRLSPRIGIAHPITERDKLFFNYGIFTQIPQFSYIYEQATQGSSAYKYYGNPALGPTKTVQYELGVEHAFSDVLMAGVTGFFKDYRDLIDMEMRGEPPMEGHIFANWDYGNCRGLEFKLDKRYSRYTSGDISYTLSWANGKSSSDRQNYDYDYQGRPIPIRDYPLDWDQRHSITVDFDLRVPSGEKPSLFGLRIPDRWGINLLYQYGSGTPYTPTDEKGNMLPNVTPNSYHKPATHFVDLKANKDFNLGPLTYSFILEVTNLFDRENVRNIDPYTGKPWGPPTGARAEYNKNPYNVYPRRNVQAGISLEF